MMVRTNTVSDTSFLKLNVTIELMLVKYPLNAILKQNRMVFLFSNYE